MALARRVQPVSRVHARRRALALTGAGIAAALLGVLALFCVLVTARAYLGGATSYVDNGDGYYLYAARRVAHGAVLYKQVMGTQPPLVYLLGAAVFKLGGTLWDVRLVSVLMRALTAALVGLAGRRFFGSWTTAALAALVYALLPIGLTWDRSFDVNPPLTLITLLAALPLLRHTPRALTLSGALAALALFTKNLYAPVLAATLLYLLCRQRRLLAPYLYGLLGGLAVLAVALLAYAGPAGLREAFLGQQSSPFNPQWFVAALAYVAANDGGVVLLALAGALLCWHESRRRTAAPARLYSSRASLPGTGSPGTAGILPAPSHDRRPAGERAVPGVRSSAPHSCIIPASDYAPWLLGGAMAVLLATLKEGTAGPVFQLAEPAVALLAAHAAVWGLRRTLRAPRLAVALAPPVLLVIALAGAITADRAALAWNNSAEVARLSALIRAHTHPGATIVAPPYYALLTETRIPGDAGDTYIVAQRVRAGDPWARRWVSHVATALRGGRIPIALVDSRLAAITPLMAALRAHYHIAYADTLPPALHVTVWLPNV